MLYHVQLAGVPKAFQIRQRACWEKGQQLATLGSHSSFLPMELPFLVSKGNLRWMSQVKLILCSRRCHSVQRLWRVSPKVLTPLLVAPSIVTRK
jgi:hypothetical protein